MVQLRQSLECLVLQAWREHWSELEWSLNLKVALAEDNSDRNKLCGYLLKQATLSEVPNKLLFNYLSYSVAAQVVSHASFLDAVANYTEFDREYCIGAVLDQLNFVRDRIRCDSSDVFRCQQLCDLIGSLFSWFLLGVGRCLELRNHASLGDLVNTFSHFVQNTFIAHCVHFTSLDNPVAYQSLLNEATHVEARVAQQDWVSDVLKFDLKRSCDRIKGIDAVLRRATTPKLRELRVSSLVISVTTLYGSVRLAENIQHIVSTLKHLQQIEHIPWTVVLRDLIRSGFLVHLDTHCSQQESSVVAFCFLKIPRIIQELIRGSGGSDVANSQTHTTTQSSTSSQATTKDLLAALEEIITFTALLNSLDVKNRCETFQFLLAELKKCQLLTDTEVSSLSGLRARDRLPIAEPAPGSQANVTLVMKAEPTFQTLLRSFYSDFAKNKEKLAQMMHHMITGKSFDLICAAAAGTGKLTMFTAKLIEFNECSKQATDNEMENSMRNPLFDLSFLLVTRIFSMYGSKCLFETRSGDMKFFDKWSAIISPRRTPDSNSEAEELFDENSSQAQVARDLLQQLTTYQTDWKHKADWGELCLLLPKVGGLLLDGFKSGSITVEDAKHLFHQLEGEVCSLLLAFGHWLSVTEIPNRTDERRRVAIALFQHVDTANTEGYEKNQGERTAFMFTVLRKLLQSVLNPVPLPLVAYPWISSTLPEVPAPPARVSRDMVKRVFQHALTNGWLVRNALGILDRCFQDGEHAMWADCWLDHLFHFVTSSDEVMRGCELLLAACYLDIELCCVALSEALVQFVLRRPGFEINCVAPRGQFLARVLVQVFLLGFRQLIAKQANSTGSNAASNTASSSAENELSENRGSKLIRLSNSNDVADAVTLNNTEASSPASSAIEQQLESLYEELLVRCQDGELRPSFYFAASFLRSVTEQLLQDSRLLLQAMPQQLLSAVIRIDPKILPPATLISLYDLSERRQRNRALQNLCLLRQLKAI